MASDRKAGLFTARTTLEVSGKHYQMHSLAELERQGFALARLPFSLRILLENLMRHLDGITVTEDDIESLARWNGGHGTPREIAFRPARVLLQDFTGVPAVVDLAAMRDAMAELGGDPSRINPLQPVELVIDHSMQVDASGVSNAMAVNRGLDYQRNRERYEFLRWGQQAFRNFKVVPPYTGICHQVNLEYLARVVFTSDEVDSALGQGPLLAYPDTVLGCDSHTPMVNGLGVLGWGVGGIEAEAAMLGQPVSMLVPQVIGFKLSGQLRAGRTATDLVLTIAEMLRAKGVVGKFVEFYGVGLESLTIADRATIGNMSPEYGATCAIFPVDAQTLRYLRLTGRPPQRIALVEAYMKAQGLFRSADSPDPEFTDTLSLDLSGVEPSVAGPKRPQDRIALGDIGRSFAHALDSLRPAQVKHLAKAAIKDAAVGQPGVAGAPGQRKVAGVWGESPGAAVPVREKDGAECGANAVRDGSVVIAAITSCTNTSNPAVMLAAGLLAQNAVARGLRSQPWVKTSLAPGSQVVTRYLQQAGLAAPLEQLGFHLVGYGCGTCIGNSGPLPQAVSQVIEQQQLVVCSVLSGNRNFEGRIHSEVRANYLMSPPLVVAFALVGRIDIDLDNEPLGHDAAGQAVYLRELWPTNEALEQALQVVNSDMFASVYRNVYEGDAQWNELTVTASDRYAWAPTSTYVKRPPYFLGMTDGALATPATSVTSATSARPADVVGARVLAMWGDSVTTDHISPAGSIKLDSPAGRYLSSHQVPIDLFNSYGARRGNHEIMMRGTFANGRIRNLMIPGVEGGLAVHLPSGEVLPIFDVATRYGVESTPLIILAGRDYGAGSSRDWAAKGPRLLGVVAVIAESFERIHRSNLVGMGILPLQFLAGQNAASLGLSGREVYEIHGIDAMGVAGQPQQQGQVLVRARSEATSVVQFSALVRLDTAQEVLYHRHGGILLYVLRQLAAGIDVPEAVDSRRAANVVAGEQPSPHKIAEKLDENSVDSFPASDPSSH